MAYEKGHLVVEDFAVGIQSVNRAGNNNAALNTLWTAKHGYSDSTIPVVNVFDVFGRFGAHNDIKIARSVSDFTVTTADDGSVYLLANTVGLFVRQTLRIGTGQWRVYLATADIYGAVATCKSSNAQNYKAVCRVVSGTGSGTSLALNGYLDISTWNVSSAARADINFSLVAWGRV